MPNLYEFAKKRLLFGFLFSIKRKKHNILKKVLLFRKVRGMIIRA